MGARMAAEAKLSTDEEGEAVACKGPPVLGPSSWLAQSLEEFLSDEMGLQVVAAAAAAQAVDGALAMEMDLTMWRELGAEGLDPARIVSALKKLAKSK